MQSKSPSVSIPQYNAPTPLNFNTPYGSVNYGNGGYTYNQSPGMQDQTNNINSMQQGLMGMMNQNPQQQLASQNAWQQAFMQQATQNTLPSLQNTLFNQGLGGSSIYGSSMANLLSNLGSQSVLNSQNMNLANQNSLQGLYSQLQGTQNANMGYAGNLMQMAGNYNLNQNQQAQQLYGTQLPYQASVNMPQQNQWLQPLMTAGGAGVGAMMGNPMMGAQVGSGIGGAISGNYNPAYSGIASMLPSQMSQGMSPLSGMVGGFGGAFPGASNFNPTSQGQMNSLFMSPNNASGSLFSQ